jgi:hypothetical protein
MCLRPETEERLRAEGDEGLYGLVWLMRHEAEQLRKQPVREAVSGMCIFVGCAAVTALIAFLSHRRLSIVQVILFTVLNAVTSLISSRLTSRRNQRTAAHFLATHYDDVRIVGPLAEALHFGHRPTRLAAERALVRLLPLLTAEHRDLLTGKQRADLYRASSGKNTNLTLAILPALKHIGDAAAIPYVEHVAAWTGDSEQIVRARALAQECLALLRERAEEERNPKILVRAADAPRTGTESLLRAAGSARDEDGAQMLRASESSGE